MESQKNQSESKLPSSSTNPAITSCRKKKSEGASFIADLRDHIDEFVHASMDEHKTCFKKTIEKVSIFCIPVAQLHQESSAYVLLCLPNPIHFYNIWSISDVWDVEGCNREKFCSQWSWKFSAPSNGVWVNSGKIMDHAWV